MLAYINGRVLAKMEDKVIIKTPSGLGYLVRVSDKYEIMVNENLELFLLEVHLREGGSELYGFRETNERKWVEKLMKVSGVGPRMAANVIYQLGWQKVVTALEKEDPSILSQVSGLGSKIAKKIVLELQGDATNLGTLKKSEVSMNSQFAVDFVDTLSGLGYKRGDIVSTITTLKRKNLWNEDNLVETVRKGLEELGRY